MGRQFPMRLLTAALLAFGILLEGAPATAAPTGKPAAAAPQAAIPMKQIFAERKALFDKVSALTGIPWYDLAAVDQYERTLSLAKKRPMSQGLIGIYYSELDWVGMANPDHEDTDVNSISFFGGKGTDGDGDGKADRHNDADLLNTMARYLLKYGVDQENFRIGLWEYYQNTRAVDRIVQFSRIYAAFDTLDLHEHVFPLPLGSEYSYRSTWGASRGWGGYRIHEGTDLFAGYGVPVRSTCYGLIEVMGWNPYGGWRVGIRDLNNVYHYYAHLSGFNKQVREGDIVKPGQVVGWVGSSGYGKPGTSGKFPPHLHYGLYRDNGLSEWSFDPYPNLRKWEREERQRRSKK